MKLKEIIEKLQLKVLTAKDKLDVDVTGGYTSDLLSDVMGHAQEGEVWITLQSHINVVAIASLKELAAILLVKGIEPEAEVLEKAKDEGITVLGTSEDTFSISGKLYQLLNRE